MKTLQSISHRIRYFIMMVLKYYKPALQEIRTDDSLIISELLV